MVKLSIIVPSYNTSEQTKKTLDTLMPFLQSFSFPSEILVIDNNSRDGSKEMLKTYRSTNARVQFSAIFNSQNDGYAKANNKALKKATGMYILFLNSDVLIKDIEFNELIDYMDKHLDVGGMTVRVVLSDDGIDPASHRGFPTVWNSFCYYSKLEKLTQGIPFLRSAFGGYHLTAENLNTIHEIDSPTGAFFLVRKNILDVLKGFDEDFFMYGEDIDLSYRIKKMGHKLIYYPFYTVLHLKNVSGFKNKNQDIQKHTRHNFYSAMKIFYKKHYEQVYPSVITRLVYFFIDLKERIS